MQGHRSSPWTSLNYPLKRTVALLPGLSCDLPSSLDRHSAFTRLSFFLSLLPWLSHSLRPPASPSFYRPAPALSIATAVISLHTELVSSDFGTNPVGCIQGTWKLLLIGLNGPSFSHALCCCLNLQLATSRFQSSYLFLKLPCFYFDSANPNCSLVFPRKQFSDCLVCQDELQGRKPNDVKHF